MIRASAVHVPRPAARSLRAEATTLNVLVQGGLLEPEAARTQMKRLGARLARVSR